MSLDADVFETSLLAELRLGLPPTFYYQLLELEDDWAFVLKIHAFFEGALTRLLLEKMRKDEPGGVSLAARDSFVSRVHLASRLQLLEPDFSAFLLTLNGLRNDLTHNLRFLAFSLRSYVDALPDREFRRTAMALGAGFKNLPVDSFPSLPAPENARARQCSTVREMFWHTAPKLSIWNAGAWTLDLISLQFHLERRGGRLTLEPATEAKLQDLLHDPAVLEYKRRHARFWLDDSR